MARRSVGPAVKSGPRLSHHFTLDDFVRSQSALRNGIANVPDPESIDNMRRLCFDVLEPAREILGVPLFITSGYRSCLLNVIVGGSQRSAHMSGRAADVVPVGALSVASAFAFLRAGGLPFDQMILECNAWIHLGIARTGDEPRREVLIATGGPGEWKYRPA